MAQRSFECFCLVLCMMCINHTRSLKTRETVLSMGTNSKHGQKPVSSLEISSFREVRHSPTFVDKTNFIKQFLQHSDPCLYIMAPAKFGKTIALDMLSVFLESQSLQRNSSLPAKSTEEYSLFEQTKIRKNQVFFDQHIQGYQVIRLDFQPYLKVTDFESFKLIHCRVICQMMSRHKYLRNPNSNFSWLNYMDNDENCGIYCLSIFDKIGYAGRELSRELSNWFESKPVVLLGDGYDALFRANFEFDIPNAKRILNKFLNFVSRLVTRNRYLKKALLVGTLNFAGVHPHLSRSVTYINFNHCPEIAPYFGFTSQEVARLLKNANKTQVLEKVKNCYDGFAVKRGPQLEMYNPFSVLSFLKVGELKGFWVQEAPSLEKFKNLFSKPAIGNEIQDILLGNSGLHAFLDDRLTSQQVETLKRYSATTTKRVYQDLIIDVFIRYLLQTGYLALQPSGPFEGDYLKVPNLETEQCVEKYLYESDYILNSVNTTLADTESLADTFLGLSKNETYFQRLAEEIHRVFKKNPPSFYLRPTVLGFLYGALKRSVIRAKFRVVRANVKLDCNENIKKGETVDLVIVTPDNIGIVLQTKYHDSSYKSLEKVMSRRYFDVFAQKFSSFKLTRIILLGVSLNDEGGCSISYVKDSNDLKWPTRVEFPVRNKA